MIVDLARSQLCSSMEASQRCATPDQFLPHEIFATTGLGYVAKMIIGR
jgi:hypothetical protein